LLLFLQLHNSVHVISSITWYLLFLILLMFFEVIWFTSYIFCKNSRSVSVSISMYMDTAKYGCQYFRHFVLQQPVTSHNAVMMNIGGHPKAANKTVVQLRPKPTTGSSFFTGEGMIHQPKQFFRFAFLCDLIIVCVRLCLILVWLYYINDFADAGTGTSLLYW